MVLRNEADTHALARACAAVMKHGDVLLLEGELGAGKTSFVTALAGQLGVTEPVRSPTYTIGHLYECANGLRLGHLDFYRTVQLDDAQWGDIEPYFEQATWTAVEWPGAIGEWIADRATWSISLSHSGGTRRLARMACPHTDSVPQLLEALA